MGAQPPVDRVHAAAAVERVLTAADATRVHATYHPAPSGGPQEPVLVVAHGFTGFRDKDDNVRVTEALGRRLALVTLDFRGHGASEGQSTLGVREVLDLDAAVGWARELGHRRVVTVGFSMGSSVAVRHAALCRVPDLGPLALQAVNSPDAVVSISGTAFWFYRGTAPMRLLHRAVSTPVGRQILQRVSATRVNVDDWENEVLPYSPEQAAAFMAPTPFLIVHGDADHYFPLEHPESVYRSTIEGAKARGLEPSAELWIEHGLAHAEAAVDDELLARVCGWAVRATEREGREGEVR